MIDTKIIDVEGDINISEALFAPAEAIKRGGLVVFPTETVYGLGADATDPEAVRSIYEAKGRPSDNPLIIHVSEPKDAERYAYTCDLYYKLAKLFMPGPLTVILPARDTVPAVTRGGLDTVAVRCPSSIVARKLISLSGVPIAAPSANLSGSPSPTAPSHVIKDMMGRVDYIVTDGECEHGLESTIVKIVNQSELLLLRPGKITAEQIELMCGCRVTVSSSVTEGLKEGERPLSPGMKYKHYAPSCPFVLLDGKFDKCIKYLNNLEQKPIAVICYSEDQGNYKEKIEGAIVYDFGSHDDLDTQAHRLFNLLRVADESGVKAIYAPMPATEGIGLALYNRMIRAAAHKIIRL